MKGAQRDKILAALTFAILFLYLILVVIIACNAWAAVSGEEYTKPTQRIGSLVTTMQSLVSALVISALALTPPGKPIRLGALGFLSSTNGSAGEKVWGARAIWAYLIVWLVVGACSLLIGYVVLPDALVSEFQILVDLGSSWFGLAVAAAYAYLGLRPELSDGSAPKQTT